jgi:co-chaperonin GroES (HSP10)
VPAPDHQKLPIKMLNDRLLVRVSREDGERRTTGGILIPATAQVSKRLVWGEVVSVGSNVRTIEPSDRVLFSCASVTSTRLLPPASKALTACTCSRPASPLYGRIWGHVGTTRITIQLRVRPR